MTSLGEKLRDHRGEGPFRLAGRGLTWARQSLSAALWLRGCDRVGRDARINRRPHIVNRGSIEIGDGVRINSTWAPVALVTGPDGSLRIGDGVFLNYGTLVSAFANVSIGNRVMVGNYGIIGDTELPGLPVTAQAGCAAEPIEIGDGAWLAARVTVLPGARIGAGSIVGAGSVVTGDIPPGVVVGGNPARVLRSVTSTR